MPGGLSDPIQGYLAFSAVKFVGYSLAGLYLNTRYPEFKSNFLLFGASRMIIGMIFGAILGMLALPMVFVGGVGILIYVLGLIPVRLLEWRIVIDYFYDPLKQTREKNWRYAGLGTAWSFVLDIPAVIGFVATGGFWIC